MLITGRNVNVLFPNALWAMKACGIEEQSRNGKVKVMPSPCLLTTYEPTERVLFCKGRKENPIFHFAECLWMMAGRRNVSWIKQFNPRMREYAEASGLLHGAYGWRWRHHFRIDQIKEVARMLRRDPTTRRAVIQIWDAVSDLNIAAKDLPCNTHIYFRARGAHLDMTVCNRSNDLVWGALGSNIVHFSFLHELIAHEAELIVGTMNQFTNNLHIYERHWKFLDIPPHCETYEELGVKPYSIISRPLHKWLRECEAFVNGRTSGFYEPFFNEVALPIIENRINDIQATDWQLACRRYREQQ